MAVTTNSQEYAKLRKWLTPYIKGPNCDAVLNALATSSTYLVNSAQAVNDSLYIATAQGQFLDLLLANYGVTRDPFVGVPDQTFREIGIQVKNRKQVRDLINNILDIVFGDAFVKATCSAQNFEPYALQDGDTLIVNFDGANTSTITFHASSFTNIGAALAQEVANAISIGLSNLGVSGSAIVNNDGNGNYVELLSDTIGASSSVTVLGGRAQNVLLFPASVPAGGNMSTQWTLSFQSGGFLRFTWSGGADPNLGVVQPQQYVNIFGGGFTASSNEGSFPIVKSQGGAMGIAYFEVNNPTGSTGIIVEGMDGAVAFYIPIRETILNKQYYAAVYNTQADILQIYMPATTQVIKRSRIGSAHLHGITETPAQQLVLMPASTFPVSGAAEYYMLNSLGSTTQYYVWFNVDGGNTDPAPGPTFVGIEVMVSAGDSAATVANEAYAAISAVLPVMIYTVVDNVVTITFPTVSTEADAGESTPNTLGPYVFDTQQGFVVGLASTTLTEIVNGETSHVITVADSSGFPDAAGYIVLNYEFENQELVPYIATPSPGTILISPAYFIQQVHAVGESVLFVTQKSPIVLPSDGSYYQGYLTDTASGRVWAQGLINNIVAAGVTIEYQILYPNPIGTGGWQSPTPSAHEIAYIYGP
jgi:hypothetical protein